jgi:hypothetical protein
MKAEALTAEALVPTSVVPMLRKSRSVGQPSFVSVPTKSKVRQAPSFRKVGVSRSMMTLYNLWHASASIADFGPTLRRSYGRLDRGRAQARHF